MSTLLDGRGMVRKKVDETVAHAWTSSRCPVHAPTVRRAIGIDGPKLLQVSVECQNARGLEKILIFFGSQEHRAEMEQISPSLTSGDSIDPQEAKKLERWIRRKYEHKEFALHDADGNMAPEPKVLVQQGKEPLAEYLLLAIVSIICESMAAGTSWHGEVSHAYYAHS